MLLAFMLSQWAILQGAPASREWFTVTQDGRDFTIRHMGDESLHWYETVEGVAVFLGSSGLWEVYEPSGGLSFTAQNVVLDSSTVLSLYATSPFFSSSDLRPLKEQKIEAVQGGNALSKTGTLQPTVVLVAFQDHLDEGAVDAAFIGGDGNDSSYTNLFNASSDSLHALLSDWSEGAVGVSASLTPWIILDRERSYYESMDLETWTEEVLNALEAEAPSGVSQSSAGAPLVIIHSGLDETRSSSGNQQGMWARSGQLSSPQTAFGGNLSFSQVVSVGALGGASLDEATDLGVLGHEFLNLMGVPDLFEYQEIGHGLGGWSVMGLGAFGYDGQGNTADEPMVPDAWTRIQLGWADPILRDVSGDDITLGEGQILKLPTQEGDEYFLLELRSGEQESLPAAWKPGALVLHIKESTWLNPSGNAHDHPLVMVEEADGDGSLIDASTVAEEGDLWSGNSILGSLNDGAANTGSTSLYDSGSYHSRSGSAKGYLRLDDFVEGDGELRFDFKGPRSAITIADFSNGVLSWEEIEGAGGYVLQRQDAVGEPWVDQTLTPSSLVLQYTDTSIVGIVDYRYRVRADWDAVQQFWSAEQPFSFQLSSTTSFDAHTGILTLEWNLPVELQVSPLDLSAIRVVEPGGDLVFPLSGGSTSLFQFPGYQSGDSLNASVITSGEEASSVEVQLSDVQRYEWIQRSNQQNNDLLLEVDEEAGTSELPSGNVQNPSQLFSDGLAVAVESAADTTAPTLETARFLVDEGDVVLGFDEPLWFTTLDFSSFSIQGGGLQTNLSDTEFTIESNVITFELSRQRHTRSMGIQAGNGGDLELVIPALALPDYTGVTVLAQTETDVFEEAGEDLVKVEKIFINNHDDTREMRLEFSEPIFFLGDVFPTAEQIDFRLSDADGSSDVLGGNAMGIGTGNLQWDVISAEASFGTPVGASAVTMEFLEEEVDAIDTFYGLFSNPAPDVYGGLHMDGFFSDLEHYLSSQFEVDQTTITNSDNYIPRRRARLIHPHYDDAITGTVATQESLIWKWKHMVTFEINGGWEGDEVLVVDWENATVDGNVYTNRIISDNLILTGNALTGKLDDHQSVLWDTTSQDVPDATNYHLGILSEDGLTEYDRSPSALEIDNTRPRVTISYLSNYNPSYKVNADSVIEEEAYGVGANIELPYYGEVPWTFNLATEEKDTTNVLIVATFNEPVVETPIFFLNQAGTDDVGPVLMSAMSGNQVQRGSGLDDRVFYYAYDVQTQNAGNFLDGFATVTITQVPDRAVGHLEVSAALEETDEEIDGNHNVDPFEQLFFSIDTIPPTIASLEFVIEDESIVNRFSTLRMYFSEDLYQDETDADPTPLDDDDRPVTGVLNEQNYLLTGTAAGLLNVTSIEGKGAGPYILTLDGIVERGSLTLGVLGNRVTDFHNNFIATPDTATALWPGPLISRNEVIVTEGGRTRLLMSGGFPPYSYRIDSIYEHVAVVDPFDPSSVLGVSAGLFTVEVTESRGQTRFVNAEVIPAVVTEVSKSFTAFRDERDYELVGFPFNYDNWTGDDMIDFLQQGGGEYDEDYTLLTYGEDQVYRKVDRSTRKVGPGYGFWMASRSKREIALNGEGPPSGQSVGIDLHEGWNIIANPFDEHVEVSSIYVSTSGTRFSIDDLSQFETQHDLWTVDVDTRSSTYLQYVNNSANLAPLEGAWIYVNNPAGTELIFFRGEESSEIDPDDIDFDPVELSKAKVRDAVSFYPPSRPGVDSTSSGGGSGGGGGGGCLLR